MIRLENLDRFGHDRCKSLYLASKNSLPVPHGIFINRDEFDTVNHECMSGYFEGRFLTLHALSDNVNINRIGGFLANYNKKKVNQFLSKISKNGADGCLLMSTGKGAPPKNSLFFAIRPVEQNLIIEGVRGPSNKLYHEGMVEFRIMPKQDHAGKRLPENIASFIGRNNESIMKFRDEFGPCVMEFGLVKGNIFFLEAKKDSKSFDAQAICLPSAPIVGRCIRPEQASDNLQNIMLAEKPDIKLSALMPFAKGFVFANGSLLCHLAVIIRESNIPAIIYPDAMKLEGKEVLLTPRPPYLSTR